MIKSFKEISAEQGVSAEIAQLIFDNYFKQDNIPEPIGKNVLLEVVQRNEKVGELYMPFANQDSIETAIVMSVGEEVTILKKGDKVGVTKGGGEMIRVNVSGRMSEYRVMYYGDVKVKY